MKTCLIVDDSSIIRKMSSFLLKKQGFEVIEAEDGLVAQTILQQSALNSSVPDLIIMDWNMPNLTGIELLKWIRGDFQSQNPKQTKEIIAIICTSEKNVEHIQQAFLAGANEYITKPFTGEIIRNKLELLGLI